MISPRSLRSSAGSSAQPSKPSAALSPGQPGRSQLYDMLAVYLQDQSLIEFVVRDSSGQIQHYHDTVRNLFSRTGEDFVLLGRGLMLPMDHVLMVGGLWVRNY